MMIYVHIPFCKQKCIYCAFYSVPNINTCKLNNYTNILCKEIVLRKNELKNEKVKTLYFGGGTPSLLEISNLQQIVSTIYKNYDLSELQEFTIEANPEQLNKDYLYSIKQLGINRLSIGVQSFDNTDLRLLNRRHSSQQAINAVKTAQDIGFLNISIDLIYGLPNSKAWEKNLLQTEQLDIQHLSCYSLTVENGTILNKLIEKQKLTMPSEDEVLLQYHCLVSWAKEHNFEQYEISNFCKQGFRSKHNTGYWNRKHYIGFGAAAHSFDGKIRRWNFCDLKEYEKGLIEGFQHSDFEELTLSMHFNEYLMTSLRTSDGLRESVLEQDFADFVPQLYKKIEVFLERGLLEKTQNGFRATEKGLLLADGIASELFV